MSRCCCEHIQPRFYILHISVEDWVRWATQVKERVEIVKFFEEY